MSNWKLTWRDTAAEGFREDMIGTKYLRALANRVGEYSPDKEWMWTKDLYRTVGLLYGRTDARSVEKSCRDAIKAAGFDMTVVQMVYELAATVWERREEQGIPDKEGLF